MNIRRTILAATSTFFYIGYLPLIPGTFGSIAGLLLFFLFKDNIFAYTLFTGLLIILGFLVTGETERLLHKKDARCIVIDEVSGMLLSLIFIPFDLKLVIIGFLLFRILDALKPYPAGLIQKTEGSPGIMGDDLLAGVYTNILLQVIFRLASLRIS